MYKLFLLNFVLFLFLSSCDGGLEPIGDENKTYLKGVIDFQGGTQSWPPQDSAYYLRVVCFKELPKDSSNIISEILSGNVIFTNDSLPMFSNSINYELEILEPPVSFVYTCVVLQYLPDFTAQRVIGVYNTSGSQNDPAPVSVDAGQTTTVDFKVDFNNPPQQPF